MDNVKTIIEFTEILSDKRKKKLLVKENTLNDLQNETEHDSGR